jgi:hypothetical protein
MSFPTIVYKCPGDHHRAGGTYSYRGAEDSEALGKLLSEGWFATLPEAIDGKAAEAEDNAAPTRAELEEKATELGISFDGRTTDKRLGEKIDIALVEKGE